tara:strand:+ start:314 stop:1117 length:804 start_codon:yes stop_codon:yes gene_type:complete
MLGNVFLKSLRDQRWSLAWWGVGVSLLAAFLVAMFPSIKGIEGFDEVVEAYPKELMAFFGASEMTKMTSATGFLNIELFALMGPLLVMIFTILRGSGAVAGEEGTGTIEMLLSEPITRGRLLAEKFASTVTATGALSIVLWAVLLVGGALTDMDIGVMRLTGMIVSLALLGLTFGAIAFAAGCVTGRRNVATGAAAAIAVATYFANVLRELVDFMEPARWISPFYYYSGADPLVNGLNPGHVAVLVVAIVVMAAAAYVGFLRRDLRL